ncbi:MAG: phosphoribosylglycinamide formyltransferase [Candidatus Krumholzibacteriota bacterium]|nr:phosphoribosylglycinamide formyltransferase [Candidatus Krumholzibacteriota bacterium]
MKNKLKVAVLASGRGSNFQALVRAAAAEDYPAEIRLLIVDNGEAGALGHARENGIEVRVVDCGKRRGSMIPEASQEMYRLCREREIGLVCLAGFMRIVKGRLLDEYEGRMINIHPALLPSFRGLDGQKQALEYGVRYSGCTVHFVDKGVDTGPVIIQKVVPVEQDDTVESLSVRILKEEHRAYPEAVRLFAEGRLALDGKRRVVIDYE